MKVWKFAPAGVAANDRGSLLLRGVLGAQLIDLLKQSLGVLDRSLAHTNLLQEKFSPGADHVVSLLGLLSVFHVGYPLLLISYGKIRFTGSSFQSGHCNGQSP